MRDQVVGEVGKLLELHNRKSRLYSNYLATPKLNGRKALEANEQAVESVLRRFEELAGSLDRQRRAWERFDSTAKQLDTELAVAQLEKRKAPADARDRLGECAALADKIVRLSGSAAAKSALGEKLASLNSKINNLQAVSLSYLGFFSWVGLLNKAKCIQRKDLFIVSPTL